MRYETDFELEAIAKDIVKTLNLNHISIEDIACIKSYGSKTRRTIARCHALGKVMQKALKRRAFYVLEFLSEKFDKQSTENKIRTIIHELLHIPHSFGGGFKHHDYVTEKTVELFFQEYLKRKNESQTKLQ